MIGEYERAFYGSQYASMAPLFEHYGIQLWMPEVGGRAAWGRRAHRLEPDPVTAPVVRWMFAQRLAGHSTARITRALNDAGVPCPSTADPGRVPHRTGAAWTLRTVAAILANPRYTGRQVWNRQRTDFDLADPANTTLGHKQVQRWNLPEGWVISKHPAHAALVSEADFIAAQDTAAPRGPAATAVRRYLLAGLLACGRCGRRLESAWSNGKPACARCAGAEGGDVDGEGERALFGGSAADDRAGRAVVRGHGQAGRQAAVGDGEGVDGAVAGQQERLIRLAGRCGG